MRLKDRVYRGPIRRAVRALDLEPRLRRIYDHLGVFLSSGTVSVTALDFSAEFVVSSAPEFARYDLVTGERAVLEAVLDDLGNGDVFWDIGANTGLYTCLGGMAVEDGQVIAFEPHPQNRDRLEENVERNGLETVTLVERALSDEDGQASLSVDGTPFGGHYSLVESAEDRTITVQTSRADSLLNDGSLPRPDVVKIDVEGAELAVIEGFGDRLPQPRTYYVEVHTETVRLEDVIDRFESAGFEVDEIHARDDERFLRATSS